MASGQFDQAIQQHVQAAVRERAVGQFLLHIEQQLPDMGSWVLPHLLWAALGLALAIVATCSFKRFRNAFQ
jgi:hypothetical protein